MGPRGRVASFMDRWPFLCLLSIIEISFLNQVYHFATNAVEMSWYEADQYCLDLDAHLAEPISADENNFLKNQGGSQVK